MPRRPCASGSWARCSTTTRLRDRVDAIAARLAAMPPTAARLMKQNLDDAVTLPLHEYLDVETERFAECSGSEESIAAARAFLTKS